MKLKMMKGLPGSGKSTTARELVNTNGSAGRINRDDLRAMIFNNEWSGKREEIIVEVEKAIAEVLLKNKLTPIIDDTNLTEKHKNLWMRFCLENGIKNNIGITLDIHEMNTSLQTCIERDNLRTNPVGEVIINRMALDARMINFDEKKIIIVDIDGTVADGSHREHFIKLANGRTKKDWYGYFTEMVYDKPIQHIIDWVNELSKEYTICIVSGRPDTYQLETLYWLHHVAKINYNYIFMRKGKDNRTDVDVKSDILEKLPKDKIFLAIDDRPSVVNGVWRKNKIKTISVAGECADF
jgi:predicted kinase